MDRTGTIISGTHRPEDLVPALHAELITRLDYRLSWERAVSRDARRWIEGRNELADTAELVSDLVSALDNLSPEGVRFGAHEGDGSDFGYWPCEQA